MGLFNFLTKKNLKPKIDIALNEPKEEELRAEYRKYYFEQRKKRKDEQYKESKAIYSILSCDELKDAQGLSPIEILMLSYVEKYSKGTDIAQFWYYSYGVTDARQIIKKLHDLGFTSSGKLTEKGKQEIKNNEYVYFWHRKSYAKAVYSLQDLSKDVHDHKHINYKDLIWGAFNKNIQESFTKPDRIRFLRYEMAMFLKDEKNYKQAFRMMLEVPFFDMNSHAPFLSISVLNILKNLVNKADLNECYVYQTAVKAYNSIILTNHFVYVVDFDEPIAIVSPVVPPDEAAKIIIDYLFGLQDEAEIIASKYNISIG